MQKFFLSFLFVTLLCIGGVTCFQNTSYAIWSWGDSHNDKQIPICLDENCSLESGVTGAKEAVKDNVTDKKFSVYIQELVVYFLSFISIIAVIYIIWAGLKIMLAGGNSDELGKAKQTIIYVAVGIVVMWLAYSIVAFVVNWVTNSQSANMPESAVLYKKAPFSFIKNTAAAEPFNSNLQGTFTDYNDQIKSICGNIEADMNLYERVSNDKLNDLRITLMEAIKRLPSENDSMERDNQNLLDFMTYQVNLAKQNSESKTKIRTIVQTILTKMDEVGRKQVKAVEGSIIATPTEGNAPLTVSFSAQNIKDPSGIKLEEYNYIWRMRESGNRYRELGRGPSLRHTFPDEGHYAVFLDVHSNSKNRKGYTDVLPLSSRVDIRAKEKIGQIVLLVNGVNISNLNSIKISPLLAKQGIFLDATASSAKSNSIIQETIWDFGNNDTRSYKGPPVLERAVYTNQGTYTVKLSFKTNNGESFDKELQLIVRNPSAVITTSTDTVHIGEPLNFTANSYFGNEKNIEYLWQIQDEDGKRSIKSSNGTSFTHTFDKVGKYIITLTAKNPNGEEDSDSKIISVESREPVVVLDVPRMVNSELPNIFTFDASKSYDPDTNTKEGLYYTWSIDGKQIRLNDVDTKNSRGTFAFSELGEKIVSVTVTNKKGKTAQAEQRFTVTSLLSGEMTLTPQVTQIGKSVLFKVTAPYAEIYNWDMGDGSPLQSGTSNKNTHMYAKAGTYTVNVKLQKSNGGEENTITKRVYVANTNAPMAIMKITNSSNSIIEEQNLCEGKPAYIVKRGESTVLDAANSVNIDGSTNNLEYTWKYMGKVSTLPTITESFGDLGCYPIELTIKSKTNGAKNTLTQYIQLKNQPPRLTGISTTVNQAKKDSQKVIVQVNANGVTDPDGVVTSYIWYYTTASDPNESQNIQISQNPSMTFVLPNITEKYSFGVILEDNDGARVNSKDILQAQSPLIIDNDRGNIYTPLIRFNSPQNEKMRVKAGEVVRFQVEAKTIIGNDITNKAQYAWDFTGNGQIDERTSVPSIEHVYTKPGDYTMKVRVTYNGVSNTKYLTIHVRNDLKASVQGYRLPNDKLYLMNTSQGVYDKARWKIGETTSDSLYSYIIEYKDIPSIDKKGVFGELLVSNNDADISRTDMNIRSIKTLTASGDEILYQSFPEVSEDGIIHIQDPAEGFKISFYGNNATAYALDIDTDVDSSLDGVPDNDIDNKDTPSYTDGSLFIIPNFNGVLKRDRTMKITLYDGTTPIKSKLLHLSMDFVPEALASQTEDESTFNFGSGGLTDFEKEKLDKLAGLIRSLGDDDRIIIMQKYNILAENWESSFDRAKTLLDIQEDVYYSQTIDTAKKSEISDTIDELLIGDADTINQLTVALKLIRDLIPKESPNYDILMGKLDEIESHPQAIEENKKIGQEMLVIIQNDPSIEDKYKLHIKNQLITLTSSDSGSPKPEIKTSSGVVGFFMTLLKIFFGILGVIVFIFIGVFGFYRMTNQDENIGFQDFLIDRIFHRKSIKKEEDARPIVSTQTVQKDLSEKTNTSVQETLVATTNNDPLKTYIPPVTETPTSEETQEGVSQTVDATLEESSDAIPDWLKPKESESEQKEKTGTEEAPVFGENEEAPSESLGDVRDTPSLQNTSEAAFLEEAASFPENDTGLPGGVDETSLPDWLKPYAQGEEENEEGQEENEEKSTYESEENEEEPVYESEENEEEPVYESEENEEEPVYESEEEASSDRSPGEENYSNQAQQTDDQTESNTFFGDEEASEATTDEEEVPLEQELPDWLLESAKKETLSPTYAYNEEAAVTKAEKKANTRKKEAAKKTSSPEKAPAVKNTTRQGKKNTPQKEIGTKKEAPAKTRKSSTVRGEKIQTASQKRAAKNQKIQGNDEILSAFFPKETTEKTPKNLETKDIPTNKDTKKETTKANTKKGTPNTRTEAPNKDVQKTPPEAKRKKVTKIPEPKNQQKPPPRSSQPPQDVPEDIPDWLK